MRGPRDGGNGRRRSCTVVSILTTDLVSLRDRGVWQGYINIVFGAGIASGGPIGGLLADSIGWRWVFAGQFPIAILAFAAVFAVLPPPPESDEEADARQQWRQKLLRIDFLGAFTLSAVAFVLLFGVAAQMGAFFFIALFYQAAMVLTVTQSGLMFVPSTVLELVGSLGGGLVMKKTGKYYGLTLTGYTILLLSIMPLVLFTGALTKSVVGVVIGMAFMMLGAVYVSLSKMQAKEVK